ncbi:MAG: OmpA family protein [Candidatus Krumholzibacteriia bacterium]
MATERGATSLGCELRRPTGKRTGAALASLTAGLLMLLVAAMTMTTDAGARTQPAPARPAGADATAPEGAEQTRQQTLARVRALLGEARDLDAHRTLPVAYGTMSDRLRQFEKQGGTDAQLAALEDDVRRMRAQARFLADLGKHRSPLEALLARYDRALRQVSALSGADLDPALSGDVAAEALLARLEQENLRRQVTVDSLRTANRYLSATVAARAAAQESVITAMRAELSEMRQQLWDSQLRAGVAEADRSAAEYELDLKQQRSAAVKTTAEELGRERGEVLLRPDGSVLVHVHGFDFGVGSAMLAPGQEALLDQLAAAVRRFPEATIRLEGHTDDTGAREANLRLSRRRAEMVAGELARRLGVPPDTVETVGMGPDHPIATNATAEGRARNRRIDLIITPPS